MRWWLSHRFDQQARQLADRHYSRQKVGSPQFVPPGRLLMLIAKNGSAVWASIWQAQIDHAWKDSWNNCLFRNEGAGLSSELILEAIAATRWKFGEPPAGGMITFIDCDAGRKKRDPGRCYRKAGFEPVGYTKVKRKLVLQMLPDAMPPARPPMGSQVELFK